MSFFPFAAGHFTQVAAISPAAGGGVPTAPAQFGTGDWSVEDDGTGDDITITITALPSDGGSAITDLEYQLDGGSWVSLAGTATGDYPVSGLVEDQEYDVAIRAVNAIGNGTASATKAVTPTTLVVFGTLNPSDKNANITLSGGDLTATKGAGGTGWISGRSQTSHSSGKFYYEWTAVEFSGSFVGAGFANASASLATYIGQNVNGISLLTNGQVFKAGAATSTLAALIEGDIACLAIDLDADLFWCRDGAGNWNGSALANPATGVGGIALPSGMLSGAIYAAVSVQVAPNDRLTVNFGATAFSQTPPSGFLAWG